MPTPNDRASAILCEFEHAEGELVGKAVVLTDRKDDKAGTIEKVWLDELHGAADFDQRARWQGPVSTIKLMQS